MAKIKEADISFVRATFFHNQNSGKVYPISWHVRGKDFKCRTFESYGKNATDYPYPIEKLPKAVQEFLENAIAERPVRTFPKEMVTYTRG